MRWKCVALLVTVTALSAASAQVALIDKDINSLDPIVNKTTQIPITEETIRSTTQDPLRDIPVNQEDDVTISEEQNNSEHTNGDSNENSSDGDNDPEPEENNSNENIPNPNNSNEGSESETNDNGSDEEAAVEDSDEVEPRSEENASDGDEISPDSSENSENEESTETELPNSNESVASRSSELASREVEVIETEGGLVQGYELHGDSKIRSFIDIPYGAFSGLFQAPRKAAAWENVHEIMEHQKRCPQFDEGGIYGGDVDCLSLSVFTPENVENAAVLFHIHDGDFKVGSANPSIYGPEYLVTQGIILVLPNYRLGALGFLCLDNEIAPGNAGLKDLTLALEWVENNIAKFGGNPSKIIVSGDGRSGALAGYLALFPISRQYVSGVITESGSVLAHWAIDRKPAVAATSLREALQQEIINEINAETVVTAAKDIYFRPCVESGHYAFMNVTPWEILNNEEDNIDIPFIMGAANHAGLQEALAHTSETLSELNENFHKFMPDDLAFKNDEEQEISEQIRKQYFGDGDIELESMEQISFFYTDAFYLGPTIRASRALVKAGAKLYLYEFSFVGELNRMLAALSSRQDVKGAARGDIVSYVFTQDGEVAAEDTDEERMVDLLTGLWVSFLKTGEPSADGVTWNELSVGADESEEEWLSIDHETVLNNGLHVDRQALWTDVYNNYFVERNLASVIQSSLSLIFTGILLLCFRK